MLIQKYFVGDGEEGLIPFESLELAIAEANKALRYHVEENGGEPTEEAESIFIAKVIAVSKKVQPKGAEYECDYELEMLPEEPTDQLAAATKRADDAEARAVHLSAHIQEVSDALDAGWEGWKERGETKAQAIAALRDYADKAHDQINHYLGGFEREQLLRDWESAVKGEKEWGRLYKDAERQRDAALAVLREYEWFGDQCLTCYQSIEEDGGHAPDCALAACLKGGA